MDQDWCTTCDAPRDIVDISDEYDMGDAAYRAYRLACGHTVVVRRT